MWTGPAAQSRTEVRASSGLGLGTASVPRGPHALSERGVPGSRGGEGTVSGVSSEVTHTELQHSGVLKRGRYLMRVRSKTPEQMSPWNLQERGSKRPKAEQGTQACTGRPGTPHSPKGLPRATGEWGGGAQLQIRLLSLSLPHLINFASSRA